MAIMNTRKHSTNAAEMAIHRLKESLLSRFNLIRSRNESIQSLRLRRDELDESNQDYAEIREDKLENTKMLWRLLILLLSIAIDFVLLLQATTILCEQFGLPRFLKLVIPLLLIIAEIGISYFQVLQKRSGDSGHWAARNAQYFVILILIGFSLMVTIFSIESYNAAVNGMSFAAYLTGVITLQVILLTASIMLHIWLIKNAESIAEVFAFLHYKHSWDRLTKCIDRLEQRNKKKDMPEFTSDTCKLAHAIEQFRERNPQSSPKFDKHFPEDLIKAMNMVMGRSVFGIGSNRID